jgi:hypothetical protein
MKTVSLTVFVDGIESTVATRNQTILTKFALKKEGKIAQSVTLSFHQILSKCIELIIFVGIS